VNHFYHDCARGLLNSFCVVELIDIQWYRTDYRLSLLIIVDILWLVVYCKLLVSVHCFMQHCYTI